MGTARCNSNNTGGGLASGAVLFLTHGLGQEISNQKSGGGLGKEKVMGHGGRCGP